MSVDRQLWTIIAVFASVALLAAIWQRGGCAPAQAPPEQSRRSNVDPDAAREAATAEARRRWPELVRAYETRRPTQRFRVLTLLGGQPVWLDITAIDGERVTGTVGRSMLATSADPPPAEVTIPEGAVLDWTYDDLDGNPVGAFRLEALVP